MPKTKEMTREDLQNDAYEKLEFALGRLESAAQAIRKSIKRIKAADKVVKPA